MSLLGKCYPAPVGQLKTLILQLNQTDRILPAKPMAPFYVAGVVILYGVNSIANAMMNSDEFKNDPRNPNAKTAKSEDKK